MNYLPTCTSRLVVQHPCQVSIKSMQGCRRSWEDKLKCVKILSVKDHNSAKISRTWIISPHALLDLWYNIPAKFHSNPSKDIGGVEKTNFDVTEGRNDGRTEGQKDGRTDKANTKCPLAILWRGHKNKNFFLRIVVPQWQQIWPWKRSKVKVTAWCQLRELVTRTMHAKYQCSIFNTSEDMSQVKVFVTEGRTDRQTNDF